MSPQVGLPSLPVLVSSTGRGRGPPYRSGSDAYRPTAPTSPAPPSGTSQVLPSQDLNVTEEDRPSFREVVAAHRVSWVGPPVPSSARPLRRALRPSHGGRAQGHHCRDRGVAGAAMGRFRSPFCLVSPSARRRRGSPGRVPLVRTAPGESPLGGSLGGYYTIKSTFQTDKDGVTLSKVMVGRQCTPTPPVSLPEKD